MKSGDIRNAVARALATSNPRVLPQFAETEVGRAIQRSVIGSQEAKAIVDALRRDPKCAALEGKMLNRGQGSWSGITLESLQSWLVQFASQNGVDAAVDSLERFLDGDSVEATEVLALHGLVVSSPVQIAHGAIQLIPFAQLPESFARTALDPPGLKLENMVKAGYVTQPALMPEPPGAALLARIKLQPTVAPRGATLDVDSNVMRLDEIVEVMVLSGGVAPIGVASWTDLDNATPFSGPMHSGAFSHISYAIIGRKYTLPTTFDILDMMSICDSFIDLPPDLRQRLRVPLQRLGQSRRRTTAVDRAIDLGIAFESLYLDDSKKVDQLSFTFRLRGAWHHGQTKAERREKIGLFRCIYECRSAAVHAGTLPTEVKVNGETIPIDKFLEVSDQLCVASIRKIVASEGFPDWKDLVLG